MIAKSVAYINNIIADAFVIIFKNELLANFLLNVNKLEKLITQKNIPDRKKKITTSLEYKSKELKSPNIIYVPKDAHHK